MKRPTEFTKDLIPKGKRQKKNIFTRSPRLKRRMILRVRDSNQKFINEINDLQEKLQSTDVDPADPAQ